MRIFVFHFEGFFIDKHTFYYTSIKKKRIEMSVNNIIRLIRAIIIFFF